MTLRARGVLPYPAAALLIALAIGCGSSSSPAPGGGAGGGTGGGTAGGSGGGSPADAGPDQGNGALTTSTSAANGSSFSLPFDATPSPDGTQIYFTGVLPDGNGGSPAVFKVAATGGTVTPLASGGSIGAPFGVAVSSDGNTIYAADPAFETATDKGAIFSVPSAGGTPTALAETVDYAPWSVTVVNVSNVDNLYFLGTDKTNGSTGIFKDVGGTVSVVLEGSASVNAQAVTAYKDGTVYFVDGNGAIRRASPGAAIATIIGNPATNLAVFFPAGLAVTGDGLYLLVPVTIASSQAEGIARVTIASGAVSYLGLTLSANREGGGLHRAANTEVYAFVDTGAGTTGTIYLLK